MSGGGFSASLDINQLLTQLFGANPTNVNGNTTNQTDVNATTTKDETTKTKSTGTDTTVGTGSTKTSGVTTTVGTADPAALATARSITDLALGKINDTTAISGLIKDVLNKASVAYGTTDAGASKKAGLYDSSTQDLLAGYAEGQAVSDSVKAVTDYQAQQENLAIQANQSIIDATKGSTTTSGSDTTTQQTATTQKISDAVSSLLGTNTTAAITKSAGTTQQNTESPGWISVICTELRSQCRMPHRLYMLAQYHFVNEISQNGKEAYWWWAKFIVAHLKKYPDSKWSNFWERVTISRAEYIAWITGHKKYQFKVSNYISFIFVYAITLAVHILIMSPRKVIKEYRLYANN